MFLPFLSFSCQGPLHFLGLFKDTMFDPAYSKCVFVIYNFCSLMFPCYFLLFNLQFFL